uniref:Uncharacterized protein n=1 Tax=Oryza sativa subsp. japonica TaxID=39947 RepID=Q6ZIJ6_ORYSJ|nr:hypothetical protein [Oryza sativa Japonica Group]BAD31064.1 hypothetical protein [Oryza sativa Japonica Group]
MPAEGGENGNAHRRARKKGFRWQAAATVRRTRRRGEADVAGGGRISRRRRGQVGEREGDSNLNPAVAGCAREWEEWGSGRVTWARDMSGVGA